MVNVTGLENEFPQGLVKFFPNPTNNLLFGHANSHAVIENVSISDVMGEPDCQSRRRYRSRMVL